MKNVFKNYIFKGCFFALVSIFLLSDLYCEPCCILTNSKQPFVTSYSMGQLGNQLFQAAAGIALALDNNAKYIHTSSRYPEILGKFNKPLPRKIHKVFSPPFSLTNNYYPIPYARDMQIVGYFLSYKYFHHHREYIREVFSPRKSLLAKIKKKYNKILKEPMKIGLHIRTFFHDFTTKEYLANPELKKGYPPPDLNYIQKAMEEFPEDAVFIVCSDCVSWAKKALKTINRKCIFTEGTYIEDFYLLTLCDHIIIGNSSFSWWAAYLSVNPDCQVIAPLPFVYDKNRKLEDTFPPGWMLIERDKEIRIPSYKKGKIYE